MEKFFSTIHEAVWSLGFTIFTVVELYYFINRKR